jgi:hypothetical protein
MKNIHVLPTDKPSRLYLHSNNELQLRTNIIRTSEDYLGTNQNIYITSDVEIKVEDWVIEFQKGDDIGEVHFINSEYVIAGDIQKKIILTTNQDLINDGVQSIDDEFLEWFVKNPSCDEVDVFYKDVYSLSNWDRRYKIIIPQEEPKQEYKYIGECRGNNDNGCFMESPGHDCGCFKRMYNEEEVLEIIRQYALEEHLITSSKPDIWFKQYKKK